MVLAGEAVFAYSSLTLGSAGYPYPLSLILIMKPPSVRTRLVRVKCVQAAPSLRHRTRHIP